MHRPNDLDLAIDQFPMGLYQQIDKARANGLQRAFIADAQDLRVPQELLSMVGDAGFDAVFSNATLHWCKRDPLGVLHSVKRVLRPGGRLIVEMGGFMNCIGA